MTLVAQKHTLDLRDFAAKFAPAIVSLVLLVLALWVLHTELGALDGGLLADKLEGIAWPSIVFALALTALSYVLLTINEAFGLRCARKPLPYARAAFVSFVSYSFAHNLGLNLLTGGSIRYRMYARQGLSAFDVAAVTLYCSVAFGIGSLTLAGIALIAEPESVLRRLDAAPEIVHGLGVLILLGIAGYFALSIFMRKPVSVWQWSISAPKPEFAAAQIAVGAIDMLVSAGIVYVLMPSDVGMGFAAFAGIYTIATWAGLISHVPGGAGVFEAVMVLLLPNVPKEELVASLLAYRVIYYLLPLIVAAAMLAVSELAENRARIARLSTNVERVVAPLLAPVVGLLVFVGGVVLLLSGATPALEERMTVLKAVVPLPFVELSHVAGSLAGVTLLILARGLFHRQDGAYYLALVVLAIGIAVSLIKGLDFEEAIVLTVILALLMASRSAFYRRSSLLTASWSAGWIASIATAIAGATWVGIFAYRDTAYTYDQWFNFAFEGDAQRFLRASSIVAIALVGYGVLRLLRLSRPTLTTPSPEDLHKAASIALQASDTLAQMVLTGDKFVLFSPTGKSFLTYGTRGRTWIALGGPYGEPSEAHALAWRFRELCDQYDARSVFYQVAAGDLPLYLDLGLTLVKVGEEAHVPLVNFSLEGKKNKDLRLSRNRAQREGLTFAILEPAQVAAHLGELRAVSDAWLAQHKANEKGFSLGFFSNAYLVQTRCAVVHHEGRIVGFANILESGDRKELSVDLMRHNSGDLHSVMDFLFAELLLWGSAQGFHWFNLGMAPLSGLENHPLAPAWHRIGSLIFRHGEAFYNFTGLRQYKEKFHPDWQPRYLASPGGVSLPYLLLDVAALISGGLKEIVSK